MVKKLIDVNEEMWNKFVGLCKMKDKLVGKELEYLIKEYLQKEGF